MYHAQAGHPSVPEITGEELMQRISDRDQAAFDRLFTRYRLLLHKIVLGILPNLADADEALQDGFLEIWKRAQNFDVRKGKPLGWIICLARRRTIDHYHKLRRRADIDRQLNGGDGDRRAVAGGEFIDLPVVDDQATGRELRQFLAAMIRDLPAEQGDAIHSGLCAKFGLRLTAEWNKDPTSPLLLKPPALVGRRAGNVTESTDMALKVGQEPVGWPAPANTLSTKWTRDYLASVISTRRFNSRACGLELSVIG